MSSTLELIILGSGPSGGTPQLGCITRPPGSNIDRCRCCESTLEKTADDVAAGDGRIGGGIRRVLLGRRGMMGGRAVILSHDHADAIFGLDDLRMFTRTKFHGSNDAIQERIDVYCEAKTFAVIKERFPYCVSVEATRGLSTVTDIAFHIIEPGKRCIIAGIEFVPLEVDHGFSIVPVTDSPRSSMDSSKATMTVPYMTLAFLIEDKILWMTDVGKIPEKTWDVLHYGLDASDSSVGETQRPRRKLPLAFIDLSESYPLRAHLSPRTFLEVVEKLDAEKSYAIGMNHTLCHGEIEALGEEVEGVRKAGREDAFLRQVLEGEEKVGEAPVWERLNARKVWFRPCYDGMAVRVEK